VLRNFAAFKKVKNSEMALKITDDCINCDACIAECPNTAIYEQDEN
jgi:NAD-dependent dihydropyrimidine dehydrogenase PreA subunit